MPGLFTTTSQRSSASSPPDPVANTSSPSRSGVPGASSTRTASRPIDRSRRTLACPSTPSPQTPTEASASADQEIGRRIAIRNAVGPARREQRRGVGGHGVGQSGAQTGQQLGAGAGLTLGRQQRGGPALVHVPHALEGL